MVIFHNQIKNHPFIDSNKRVGILVMMTFLEINGIEIICTDDEFIRLGLELANRVINDIELLNWIISTS